MLREIKKTMNHIKYISLMLIVFLIAIGCAGDYGTLKRQTSSDNKMTLAQLRENWEDYHIYYSKSGGTHPKNIMFDPKNDEKRIVGDAWYKITDQETLSETINEIEIVWDYQDVVIVEGPNGQFFGYVYSSWNTSTFNPRVSVGKLVDEHTLEVSVNR